MRPESHNFHGSVPTTKSRASRAHLPDATVSRKPRIAESDPERCRPLDLTVARSGTSFRSSPRQSASSLLPRFTARRPRILVCLVPDHVVADRGQSRRSLLRRERKPPFPAEWRAAVTSQLRAQPQNQTKEQDRSHLQRRSPAGSRLVFTNHDRPALQCLSGTSSLPSRLWKANPGTGAYAPASKASARTYRR